jgi:hypothetical protein
MQKEKSALKRAQAKYEKTTRGAVVLRVQLSGGDNLEEWEKIKEWLIDKGGNAKAGIYQLAKDNNVIK